VGDYRVIYFLDEERIKVVRIATRSDAYSWLD
jgi:mRNA-degrading endonuclease RelE of RelBE toxin-antitoxin system